MFACQLLTVQGVSTGMLSLHQSTSQLVCGLKTSQQPAVTLNLWVTGLGCLIQCTCCGRGTLCLDQPYPALLLLPTDIRIIPSGAPVESPPPLPSSPSPSPAPSTPSPSPDSGCPTGASSARAACKCQGVTVYKYYADKELGCAGAYWCYGPSQSAYASCSAGLLFNEAKQQCDWPVNVDCQAPSLPTPSPSPIPSPSPVPEPSPSPSPAPQPDTDACPTAPGDARAACFCRNVTEYKHYADTANSCRGAIWCYAPGRSSYASCGAGLLFSQAAQVCDWAANVQCAALGPVTPGPVSPSPEVGPSPSPSPPTSPPTSPPLGGPRGNLPAGPLHVVYYQTWSAPWAGSGAALDLARIPGENPGGHLGE